MTGWFSELRDRIVSSRNGQDDYEREKMAALEDAEQQLASLRERSEKAMEFLEARDKSNHWRESIEQMIHGAI